MKRELNTNRRVVISKTYNQNQAIKEGPGPGSYDLRGKVGEQGISIGKSLRERKVQSLETPGIGSYNIIQKGTLKGGKFNKDRKESPSPRQYNLNS